MDSSLVVILWRTLSHNDRHEYLSKMISGEKSATWKLEQDLSTQDPEVMGTRKCVYMLSLCCGARFVTTNEHRVREFNENDLGWEILLT
jgi:hypothetical protein